MALAGLIEYRRQPQGWHNSLRVPEARWNVDRADKGQGYDRPHARDGHQPLTDFIVAREQENLASLANFPRKTRRAASKGSIISANSGTPSTRSWIRCSKPTTPTIPTFSPKLRNKPRISFSIARAFSWSIFRAARSALRFWLASVLTCTGWNKPTRIICANPRASLRSLLLTCALRNAFACHVSMQIAGTPASANPLNSHCDRGPASRPTRSSRHAGSQRTARRSSG